jgi:hypothetical protein
VRRVILTLLASSVSTAAFAEMNDALVMPYRCGLKDGRVALSPSRATRYPIVGAIDRQAITTCRRSGRCRTLTVHRFVISCDGAGVPWMRVAAAIRHAKNAPAWIDHGRLNLVLAANKASKGGPACVDPPAFGLGARGSRAGASAYECPESTRRGEYEQVSLPAGFAPVAELGARLSLVAARGPLDTADTRGFFPGLRRVSTAVGETTVAKVDPDEMVEAIPGLEPYEPGRVEQAGADDDWVTVINTEPQAVTAGISVNGAGGGSNHWAWLLSLMAIATAGGLMRTRLAQVSSLAFLGGAMSELWSGARASGGNRRAKLSSTGAAVAALLERTEAIAKDLKAAGPLREVLQSELRLVRQRLAALDEAAAADAEGDGTMRRAPQYRGLVRELERIGRIADSAAASLSRGRPGPSLPRTVAEAYDVLGVNPGVSEDVLKKIVDALRMSWHPDHARGDDDRNEREARIRQINVAWELITAKREAA